MGGNDYNGILIVDKPAGMSSAQVVAFVKNRLKARKVGHAGTLDPFATGVLLCCINSATKLSRFFLHDKKKYSAILELGIETDTQDSTGTIISTCDKVEFTEQAIREVFVRFQGEIEQIPPSYSALKHQGVPLYKHARRGNIIKKPASRVHIYDLNVCKINLPLIHFEVTCSGGTYIRALGSDIGRQLGCGARLKDLRRLGSSGFSIENALTLPKLEEYVSTGKILNHIISMSDSLHNMPAAEADDELRKKIRHGIILKQKDLNLTSTDHREGFIKVHNKNQELIAVLSHDLKKNELTYCCVFEK